MVDIICANCKRAITIPTPKQPTENVIVKQSFCSVLCYNCYMEQQGVKDALVEEKKEVKNDGHAT